MEDLDVKHTRVASEQCGSPLDNVLQGVIANYARIADRLGPVSIAPGSAGSHVTSRQRESFRVIVYSVHSVEDLDSVCLQRLLPERRLNPAREGMEATAIPPRSWILSTVSSRERPFATFSSMPIARMCPAMLETSAPGITWSPLWSRAIFFPASPPLTVS